MIATAALQAAQAEFEFKVGPHAASELAVVDFDAEETLSPSYSFEVLLAPPDVEVDEKGDVVIKSSKISEDWQGAKTP
ncbi:MAG TPA: hypothetical protein VEU33_10860 [Archangium sp.]|nr:hypothetical protein [Archangium sp.]